MDHTRHIDIYDVSKEVVTLIGAGGIGATTAIALAKMGISALVIYDMDSVGTENLATQLHRLSDVGKSKVEAISDAISTYANDVTVFPRVERVTADTHFDTKFLKGCDRDGMQDQNGYRFHFYPAKQEMSETRTPHHYGYWRSTAETPQSPLDYASSTCLGGFNTIIYSLAGCGDVTEYLRNAYIYLNRHSPHDQLRFSSIRSFPWAEVVR